MTKTCLICGRIDDADSVTCPDDGEASWATAEAVAPVEDPPDSIKTKKKAKQ